MSCQLDRAIPVMDNKHKYVADLKHPTLCTPSLLYHPQTWNFPPSTTHHPFTTHRLETSHPLQPITHLPPTDLKLPTLYNPSPFLPPTDLKLPTLCNPSPIYHPQTWNFPPSTTHHLFYHPQTWNFPPSAPHCPFTTQSQCSCQVLVLTLWSLQVNCCWRPRSRVKQSPPHLVLTGRSPATWNSPGCHSVQRHFIRRSMLQDC